MKPGTLKPVELVRLARDGMRALQELCEDADKNCDKCALHMFKCPGMKAVNEGWADEIENALIEMGAYEEGKS